MSIKQNGPTGPKPPIIEPAQHQFGFELNINHSSEQRQRTQIMLESIRRSQVLKSDREINRYLEKRDVLHYDVRLKK